MLETELQEAEDDTRERLRSASYGLSLTVVCELPNKVYMLRCTKVERVVSDAVVE